MKIKKRILMFSIAILMVFSPMLVMNDSYAYWQGDVQGSSNSAAATITAGAWQQGFQWDPNATYAVGDLVTNNNVTYRAKKANPTREPGVSNGWTSEWTAL